MNKQQLNASIVKLEARLKDPKWKAKHVQYEKALVGYRDMLKSGVPEKPPPAVRGGCPLNPARAAETMEKLGLTLEQAETIYLEKIKAIDAIRASGGPDMAARIAVVDAEIAEMKKATGHRHIGGVFTR